MTAVELLREKHFNRKVQVFNERPKNITQVLYENVKKRPERPALVYFDQSLSYKETWEQVESIATNLSYLYGIKKGDRVAVLLGNCIEYCLLVYACARIGAVLVPLNTRLKEKELAYMLNHSGARLIIVDDEFVHKISSLQRLSEISNIQYFFLIDRYKDKAIQGYLPFHLLTASTGENLVDVKVYEDDPLFIMYTSGTTGLPKGAVGSHLGIIHSLINYELSFHLDSQTKTLIAVPLFHVTGLIGQLLLMAKVGGTAVVMRRYKTDQYVNLLFEKNITFLFNVPTIYTMMLAHETFTHSKNDNVHCIAYGGAAMPTAVIQKLRNSFDKATLHNCYGATETSSPTTIMPREYPESKATSVGLPVLGAEIKVINEQGELCPTGVPGELLIKGAMVIEEYWNNEEANQNSYEGEYWRSGDIAKIDENGFVYIMDRKKDMINRGGEKIFSIEIENTLHQHPNVLEAAVIGISDSIFGEVAKAFIVPVKGKTITEDEVKQFVRDRLADYKVPAVVDIVNELEKNPNGKIVKNKLRQQQRI